QLLYEGSEETPGATGLGVLPGTVRTLPDGVKRPQMQWNTLQVTRETPLLAGLGDSPWMYFVHSYAPEVDGDVVATCDYGGTVAAIVGAVHPSTNVQASGGVRDRAAAEELIDTGVGRVVLGTAALERPELVKELAADMPLALGLDVRGNEVAVRGWVEGSGEDVVRVLCRFEDVGLAAAMVTQIAVDGTMAGPDLECLARVLDGTLLQV